MKTFLALACLALVGCPTSNTPGDASVDRDAPPGTDATGPDASAPDAPTTDAAAAPCMPGGTWLLGVWSPDAANAPDCMTPDTTPLTFGVDGVPVGSDGSPLVCPASCDATSCSITPVSAPTCTGSFRILRACSGGPGGTARFAIHGETADFEAELETTTGTCIFRVSATRAR
jgi:hypothetical protein